MDDYVDVVQQACMRVLHIIPSVAPCRGGPSEAVLAMCRALKAQNVDAEILTTNDAGSYTLPTVTGRFIDHEGVRTCFLPRWSPRLSAAREFQYSCELVPWLKDHLTEYAGVHVHALFSHLPTQGMKLARRQGVNYVVRPLGLLDPWSLAQGSWKKRWYLRLFERANLQVARAVHCTSAVEAANVRRLLPRARTEIISHGIAPFDPIPDSREQVRVRFGIPADHCVFLFLSRWHPKKNIPLLLQALKQIPAKEWTLVMAGDGPEDYKATIQGLIETSDLKSHVVCPGHVGGTLKACLLQGADAFVLPSESENFGISVGEALVNGLRCVVTRGVDLAPVVQSLDGGKVCDASVSDLAASLHDEFRRCHGPDPELRKRALAQFSWSLPATQLKDLYGELFCPPARG